MSANPFIPVLTRDFARLRGELVRLRENPPQVLLFEGGTDDEREALALYWACVLHCAAQEGEPCLTCPACTQIGERVYTDVLAYDGRISNKEDEENPGSVRAFNIENIRQLKMRLRDAQHSHAKRVVILAGLDNSRDEAANALLKALEEPSETTVFVLLAAEREQLLPTLVSRSWVVTLPWPETGTVRTGAWESALAGFLTHGQGWLDKTAARGAVTPAVAGEVLLACQKALSHSIAPAKGVSPSPLASIFAALPVECHSDIVPLIDEAQEALQASVNPARILDSFATRLYLLLNAR